MKRKQFSWKDLLLIVVLSLIIGWFFPASSKAEDLTITWENPTTAETCVDAGETTIEGIHIWERIATVAFPATTFVIPAKKPGSYLYAATAFNSFGESRLSATREKVSTSFTVTDQRAYIVAKTLDRFLLLVVGTVPIGTACDVNTEVNGMNAVPREAVTFTGARDILVVAKCG